MQTFKTILSPFERGAIYTKEALAVIDKHVERCNKAVNSNLHKIERIKKAISEMVGEENLFLPTVITRELIQEDIESEYSIVRSNLTSIRFASQEDSSDNSLGETIKLRYSRNDVTIPVYIRFPYIVYTNMLKEQLPLRDTFVKIGLCPETLSFRTLKSEYYFEMARSTFSPGVPFHHSHGLKGSAYSNTFASGCMGSSDLGIWFSKYEGNSIHDNPVLVKGLITAIKAYISYENIEEGPSFHCIPTMKQRARLYERETPAEGHKSVSAIKLEDASVYAEKIVKVLAADHPSKVSWFLKEMSGGFPGSLKTKLSANLSKICADICFKHGIDPKETTCLGSAGKFYSSLSEGNDIVEGKFLTFNGEAIFTKISSVPMNVERVLHPDVEQRVLAIFRNSLIKANEKRQAKDADRRKEKPSWAASLRFISKVLWG